MYEKRIAYDRDVHDYAMYIKPTGHDEFELVGFARTYHEAEITLDQLVFELMSGQFFSAGDPPADEGPPIVIVEAPDPTPPESVLV